ncbi:transcription initiation factor IIB [Kalmusia sp. IMI 367209]|nr:transcription initiation factor IIB [Kalmusia sp. IMI 367209]
MSFAPDGRQLSPGEVWVEMPVEKKEEEWREDLNVILMCPDCREVPPNLVENFSRGDTVCGDCGRVLSERNLDFRSEWRTFSNDDQGNDDPSRVGDAANPLLHGSQLQTEIAFGDASNRHRELSRAQNKSNSDKANKSLQAAYGQISTLCESNFINKTIAESAKLLYKITDDGKVFKGKSQDAVIAGCIFIACRQHDSGRSFREIYKLTKVSKKEIGRTFKVLENYLQQHKKKEQGPKASGNGAVMNTNAFNLTRATTASELIGRACSKLNIGKYQMIAEECAQKVPVYISWHTSWASRRHLREIGAAVDVSDGTIRTAYKLMYAAIDDIIDPKWITEKGGDRSRVPVA